MLDSARIPDEDLRALIRAVLSDLAATLWEAGGRGQTVATRLAKTMTLDW